MQSSVRVHGNFRLGMAGPQLCTHREGPCPCWLPSRGGMGTHTLRAAAEVMVGHTGCPRRPSLADPGSNPPAKNPSQKAQPCSANSVSQVMKGPTVLCQLCPQINPVFTARGGNGVIPAEANGRREEERGEGGDATDRETLASDLWLLIQLKGLIPRDAPAGKAASKRSPAGRYGH